MQSPDIEEVSGPVLYRFGSPVKQGWLKLAGEEELPQRNPVEQNPEGQRFHGQRNREARKESVKIRDGRTERQWDQSNQEKEE